MGNSEISPLAKRLADENNVDWRVLRGTGEQGRIVERDVLDYLARVMAGEEDLDPTPEPLPAGMESWSDGEGDRGVWSGGTTNGGAGANSVESAADSATESIAENAAENVAENSDTIWADPDDALLDLDDRSARHGAASSAHTTGEEPDIDEGIFVFDDDAPTAESTAATANDSASGQSPSARQQSWADDLTGFGEGQDQDDSADFAADDFFSDSSRRAEETSQRAAGGEADSDFAWGTELDAGSLAGEQDDALTSEAPQAQEPAYQETPYQESSFEEPQFQEPQFQEPQFQEPAYREPVREEPAYQEPSSEEELGFETPQDFETQQDEVARYGEPAFGVSQYEEPQFQEPQFQEPQPEESQFEEPAFGARQVELPRQESAQQEAPWEATAAEHAGTEGRHEDSLDDYSYELPTGVTLEEAESPVRAGAAAEAAAPYAPDQDQPSAPAAETAPAAAAPPAGIAGRGIASRGVAGSGIVLRRDVDLSALVQAQQAVSRELDLADVMSPASFLVRAAARAGHPWPLGSADGVVSLANLSDDGITISHLGQAAEMPFRELVTACNDASMNDDAEGSSLVVADLSVLGIDEAVLGLGRPVLTLGRILPDEERGRFHGTLALSGPVAPDAGSRFLARLVELLAAPVRLVL